MLRAIGSELELEQPSLGPPPVSTRPGEDDCPETLLGGENPVGEALWATPHPLGVPSACPDRGTESTQAERETETQLQTLLLPTMKTCTLISTAELFLYTIEVFTWSHLKRTLTQKRLLEERSQQSSPAAHAAWTTLHAGSEGS